MESALAPVGDPWAAPSPLTMAAVNALEEKKQAEISKYLSIPNPVDPQQQNYPDLWGVISSAIKGQDSGSSSGTVGQSSVDRAEPLMSPRP